MSSSLGFSTFSNMENKEAPKKKRERFKNKTIKKRSSKKVEQFLNSMNKKESFGVRVGSDHRSGAGTRRTIDDDLLSDSEDELDKEVERLKRIDEQDRRREMRRLARKTPQQLAEQRRRHEHEIGMARARIRINPLIGEEVSSRDRILTRVSTPRLIVREPPNITIAEPVKIGRAHV
mgnify:CR=1 FL=1